MKIFAASSYIEFIRSQIEANAGLRGYQARLSEAAGVHSSYFSRVLSESIHLTPDQAANLALFWRLNSDATDYFICLVNLARASSPVLKSNLERQLNEIRRKQGDIASRLKQSKKIHPEENVLYYSAWHYSAIHMLVMLPEYKTVKKIAKRLGVSENLVDSACNTLESFGLLYREGETFHVKEGDVHLTNKAAWAPLYHSTWRQRAAARSLEGNENDLHFSALHCLSRADFENVKEELRLAIEKIRSIVGPSPEEEVIVVNLDAYQL